MYKSVEDQKRIWGSVISAPGYSNNYSYSWGNPESHAAENAAGDVLGDYKKIKDEYLMPFISFKKVLEIGCFDGKWTKYMAEQQANIFCADIIDQGFEIIKQNVYYPKLSFFKINGENLDLFNDKSFDYVFCIDSLVRSEKQIILSYIYEIKRVLKNTGRACIHLPAEDQQLSWKLGFTQIGSQEIDSICQSAGIEKYRIDKTTLNHGVLLLINI